MSDGVNNGVFIPAKKLVVSSVRVYPLHTDGVFSYIVYKRQTECVFS